MEIINGNVKMGLKKYLVVPKIYDVEIINIKKIMNNVIQQIQIVQIGKNEHGKRVTLIVL
jgi:hypothetical protein